MAEWIEFLARSKLNDVRFRQRGPSVVEGYADSAHVSPRAIDLEGHFRIASGAVRVQASDQADGSGAAILQSNRESRRAANLTRRVDRHELALDLVRSEVNITPDVNALKVLSAHSVMPHALAAKRDCEFRGSPRRDLEFPRSSPIANGLRQDRALAGWQSIDSKCSVVARHRSALRVQFNHIDETNSDARILIKHPSRPVTEPVESIGVPGLFIAAAGEEARSRVVAISRPILSVRPRGRRTSSMHRKVCGFIRQSLDDPWCRRKD